MTASSSTTARPAFAFDGMHFDYRPALWEGQSASNVLSTRLAIAIRAEADMEDVLFDAYAEHAARQATPNEPNVVIVSPAQRDNEAAMRQAELLGASADQRAKLRAIVEERAQAQRDLAASQATIAEMVTAHVALQAQVNQLREPIGASDPRLIPIWVAAAEEADAQGYCSVYDGIAAHVGAPDRDELGSMGYLNKEFYADIEVTVTVRVSVPVTSRNRDAAWSDARDLDWSELSEYVAAADAIDFEYQSDRLISIEEAD